MRTLVLYETEQGSTQKYAEDIAKAVGGTVLPLKKFKPKTIDDYDVLVFGGWVRGNQIMGLNKFLSYWDAMEGKDVIVFSSGLSVVSKDGREEMIQLNVLYPYHLRYYMLRGSFDFKKLSFKNRLMMNMSLNRLASQQELSVNDQQLLAIKDTPITYYDQEGVNRIVTVINKIALEKIS